MALKLHVVFHGAGSAFFRMPGCPCARCAEPVMPDDPTGQDLADLLAWARQAHTAASLVIEEDGIALDHTLVDCGMGVMSNLAALPTPARDQPISRLLLTHAHLDHVAGIDGLLHALHDARKAGDFSDAEQPWPLPLFATEQTWRSLTAVDPDDKQTTGLLRRLTKKLRQVDITDAATHLDTFDLHPALQVTPIPAEHFQDSVNYLFTFWPSGHIGDGAPLRVALCWDLLAYPAGRKADVWHTLDLHPQRDPLLGLMRGVDLLAVEMTNWRPVPNGHITFEGGVYKDTDQPTGYGARDLLAWWQPKQARIVHYSGWDDRHLPDGSWQRGAAALRNVNPATGPVRDRDLRRALRASTDLGQAIDVAQAGQVITLAGG